MICICKYTLLPIFPPSSRGKHTYLGPDPQVHIRRWDDLSHGWPYIYCIHSTCQRSVVRSLTEQVNSTHDNSTHTWQVGTPALECHCRNGETVTSRNKLRSRRKATKPYPDFHPCSCVNILPFVSQCFVYFPHAACLPAPEIKSLIIEVHSAPESVVCRIFSCCGRSKPGSPKMSRHHRHRIR
jgi:hypothetical protein